MTSRRQTRNMQALFCLAVEPQKSAGVSPLRLFADSVTVAAIPPFQRASSPLRKHKRKAAQPHRSALDGAVEPAPLGAEAEEEEEIEIRTKERRSSASPDPAAQRMGRPARPQRAASLQHPLSASPAPDQLGAAFDIPTLPPPPFLATAASAPAGGMKVCVQCGTSQTPMWRQVNGLTYCNADGLRLKRKLGLL